MIGIPTHRSRLIKATLPAGDEPPPGSDGLIRSWLDRKFLRSARPDAAIRARAIATRSSELERVHRERIF